MHYILYGLAALFSLACLYPFLLLVSGSFTPEELMLKEGLRLLPARLSTLAYSTLFYNKLSVMNAYGITITVTVVGTFLSIIVTALLAYPLARRELRYRNGVAFFVFFTMLFNGGMLPWYLVCVSILHLRNTLLALIVPYLAVAWNVFLLRNYFQTIPVEIPESAKIDGAGELRILFQIIVPLSRPAIAVLVLFIALMYWNDWWLAIMLTEAKALRPLQLMLRDLITASEFMTGANAPGSVTQSTHERIPTEGLKFAATVVTIGPIMFLYPFLQKYFVKGIIMGAIKG
jgi:putative aldouronate transport system permease protein